MTLPPGCAPCFHVVRRVVRHVRHHVTRHVHHPVHHRVRHVMHHIARHPGKLAIAVCCVGTVGPLGGALPTPPPNAPHAAPAVSQAWPEIPSYSGISIGGGGAVPLHLYSGRPVPQFIPAAPAVYSPLVQHTPSVPEPSTLALLLLPAGVMALLRRART